MEYDCRDDMKIIDYFILTIFVIIPLGVLGIVGYIIHYSLEFVNWCKKTIVP